jgi:hypothetical protein
MYMILKHEKDVKIQDFWRSTGNNLFQRMYDILGTMVKGKSKVQYLE